MTDRKLLRAESAAPVPDNHDALTTGRMGLCCSGSAT
jgi:hypothetical protein